MLIPGANGVTSIHSDSDESSSWKLHQSADWRKRVEMMMMTHPLLRLLTVIEALEMEEAASSRPVMNHISASIHSEADFHAFVFV